MSVATPRAAHRARTVGLPGSARRVPRRQVVVTAVLTGVTVLLALLALGLGDYPLSPVEVVRAALDPAAGFAHEVVVEWRLPRVLTAVVFGAALGVSGAVFQSLTRNPLGSPDIIGFVTGSYTGALVALTVLGTTALSTTLGALLGGLGTAVVVYLLAYRDGILGFRLIIVGIAVTAALHAVNTYLLLRAETEVAMAAAIWGAGSISLVGWEEALPAFLALALLTPLGLLAPSLRQLELGDDAARAHGLRVEPARLLLVLGGVALTAVVTATAGPIAFVALAAPQIARRLTASAGLPLLPAAATGALLMLGADVVAQHALPGGGVPVGIVTVVGGGVYLLALLMIEVRRR